MYVYISYYIPELPRAGCALRGSGVWGRYVRYIYTYLTMYHLSRCVRLSEDQGWASLPYLEDEQPGAIAAELDCMSLCCVLVWMNLLVLVLPFKKLGQLLLSTYCMLMGDVCRWVLIFLVFLGAFAIGSYVALIMSHNIVTDVWDFTMKSRYLGLADLCLQFCYMGAGEVVPGTLAMIARNTELIKLYNLAFILLVTVVLINLLIALMGSTFTHHSQLGRQMWWIEFADLVLRYEKRLSATKRIMYRSGEGVGDSTDAASCKFYFVDVAPKSDTVGMVHGKASDDGDVDQLQKQVNCLAAGLTQVEKDVAALTSLLTNHFSHQTPPTLQHAGSATATSYSSLRSGDDALVLQESALATKEVTPSEIEATAQQLKPVEPDGVVTSISPQMSEHRRSRRQK